MLQQGTPLKFDPFTGGELAEPIAADAFREEHDGVFWLFNPWTGRVRASPDFHTDPFGLLIVPPNEPVYAGTP
jgi:hypothetical protein